MGLVALVLGGIGESTDVAYHVDFGRDENLLTVPHTLILLAVGGIVAAGLLSLVLPGPRVPGTLTLGRYQVPPGGLVLLACGAVALAAFPLDGTWHELFGEDLTLWSPTHLLLIGGPTLSILGMLLLLRQGAALGKATRATSAAQVLLAGFFLGALTDLQSEFGFGVPQFRLLFHPITVAFTAGLTLVFARVLLGRLGALKALAVYYVMSALPLLVLAFDTERTIDRVPLYLASALTIELLALRRWRNPLSFGALAGLGAGTIGLAAEWGWSQLWMPFPWTASLLPEAALLAALAGTAAGLIGARAAAALTATPVPPLTARLPSFAPVAAAFVVLIAIFAIPLERSGTAARATIVPFDSRPGSTQLRVALDPPTAAQDAEWFRVTAFHGGTTEQVALRRVGPGRYITERPVPVGGERDATLRLARGRTLASVTVYSPGDEHGEEPTPLGRRSQRFEAEHALPPVEGWRADLQNAGYAVVAGVALLWLAGVWRGFALLEGRRLVPARRGLTRRHRHSGRSGAEAG